MAYADPNTIHNPATGTVPPAAWGDQVRDNLEFLIDPPVCSVFHSTTQSVTTSTQTTMLADSEQFDNNSMHSTVSNTSRITAQIAGRYLLLASINWAINATGQRRDLRFMLNGTTQITGSVFRTPPIGGGGLGTPIHGAVDVVLSVGDYCEVQGLHDAGVNITGQMTHFSAVFLTR